MSVQGGSRAYGSVSAIARRMRSVARLESNEGVADDHGEIVADWQPVVAAMRCAVESKGGTELNDRGQVVAVRTVYVTTRWRDSITPTAAMRIKIGTRVLNVTAVYDPDETRRVLVFQCTEIGG